MVRFAGLVVEYAQAAWPDQMGNMLAMYALVSLFNWRKRRNSSRCEGQVSTTLWQACLVGRCWQGASVHALLYHMASWWPCAPLSLFKQCISRNCRLL